MTIDKTQNILRDTVVFVSVLIPEGKLVRLMYTFYILIHTCIHFYLYSYDLLILDDVVKNVIMN